MTPAARLALLALPLAGLAGAWCWTHMRAQQGVEWDVPVDASGPRASLRGRFVSFRYAWPVRESIDTSWTETAAALCLDGAPPVLAEVRASDPNDRTCRYKALAVDDDSRHAGIHGGVLYVPQEEVPAIRRQLNDPALRPIIRIRLNEAGAITPLSIAFRPR